MMQLPLTAKVLITLKLYRANNYCAYSCIMCWKLWIESAQEMYLCIIVVENVGWFYNNKNLGQHWCHCLYSLSFANIQSGGKKTCSSNFKNYCDYNGRFIAEIWHSPKQTGLNWALLTQSLIINTFFMNSRGVNFTQE